MSEDFDPLHIDATAAKRFFIDMLVKDIELIPAIADLVDNSVDGARSLLKTSALGGQWINIQTNDGRFAISDNSGGIDPTVARKYAFRFGRPAEFHGTRGSVGQFGIGMKRALFKLGTEFEVDSASEDEHGAGSTFSVSVNVGVWAADENDWSFRFSSLKEGISLAPDLTRGTTIRVDALHPSVSDDLADPVVLEQLMLELRTRHQESIRSGLKITVNGHKLTANTPELQYSDEIRPINDNFTITTDRGDIRVRIVAGTVATAAKDATTDEGSAQNFTTISPAGWYVFCNERLLLAADKSSTTGWGSVGAVYHPQYRNFRGYVYMDADDASLLPWNTTKTAVDRDSAVYREVLSRMKLALSDVQSLVNRVKGEKERIDEGVPSTPLVTAFSAAPNVAITQIPASAKIVAPATTPLPRREKTDPNTRRIQYSVDSARFDRLAELFETSNGSELGRQTFDYVYKVEIG